ncbi:MAG: DeoR family transcriptional regulator [Patescibacteria group bacterium]
MESLHYLNSKSKIKDNTKGQKIAAALYLVTAHMSDTDPLKTALRTHAVTVSTVEHDGQKAAAARAIDTLLNTAVMASIISEKNASIISLELRHYVVQITTDPDTLSSLFAPVPESLSASQIGSSKLSHTMSYNPRTMSVSPAPKAPVLNENKSKRQDVILSFINERKSVGIKDIAALFSDTSEKTIQRELSALVSTGKITKRGEKRWSVYMAVSL